MTKYKIFVSTLQNDLENKIDDALKTGWKLQGGICCAFTNIDPDSKVRKFVFLQAMTKIVADHDKVATFQ